MTCSPLAQGPGAAMLHVPLVAMRCVERVYPGPPPVHALTPTDLAVHRGEYVAVVGPSGSGKSTLLHLIGLLDRPVRGTYEFCGRDTAAMRDYERAAVRARHIGFVFQALRLLPHRTALENVMLARLYSGAPRATRRPWAAEALEQVGLAHRAHALANTLSEGERRRVAIARALVNHPCLLLCDEPTGNVDGATATAILDLLDALHSADSTLMVVTHDPAVAARAQRTITLRAGSLEPGPPPAALEPA
ncbi:MAG TPA: ABC transporter ATP-binding protein [Actinocrinis sp.]|nr:ABC transporter ATP-binding protein [Actinocrinis sp.]